MTQKPPERPHFRQPPILEQAISLNFERIATFDSVDFGLFWQRIESKFPKAETAPRFAPLMEGFEDNQVPVSLTFAPPLQLPRSLFSNVEGEMVQVQDDSFGFNWIKPTKESVYPRFEKTSSRLWELYEIFLTYLKERKHAAPILRQCEITNVNLIFVREFGTDYSDMGEAFLVDPFAWEVEGLVAETYVRRRQHKLIDKAGEAIGRLHSVITPVFAEGGEKAFQFELTARSRPNIRTLEDAKKFIEHAHQLINSAFWVSVTPKIRRLWGEYNG